MPIPKPHTGESRDDFISRCMANPTMVEEYESDQRMAICSQQWRDRDKELDMSVRHTAPVESIKASGDAEGTFDGYASVWGVVDAYHERVMPGSMTESLVKHKRSGTQVRMFWGHRSDSPIGRWLDIAEDKKGLYVKGKLTLGTQLARDTYELMKDGAVDGLSIGFREVKSDQGEDGVRELTQIDLLEISVVTLPANPKATIDEVKSSAALAARFETLCKALRDGKPQPAKEFEDILREAGVPKSMATMIASVGYAKAIRSDSDGGEAEVRELLSAARQAYGS